MDRHGLGRAEDDVTQTPVPAALSESWRRLSANRRRDERGSSSTVLAAGSKGHLQEASSAPPEQRKYHRPRTPANNEMKLTSSASLGGRRLQLISVFSGRWDHPRRTTR
jgi:hypothetical protein